MTPKVRGDADKCRAVPGMLSPCSERGRAEPCRWGRAQESRRCRSRPPPLAALLSNAHGSAG